MKGNHHITVSTAKVKYNFTVHRNITIIKGDSATGKTTLVEMIRDYYENGRSSGIQLSCDKICRVIGGRDWKAVLSTAHDSIIFIDEDNSFLPTNEFAEAVKASDNYYVIFTREGLPNLPYSVTEIYGIRVSGKYVSLTQTYNEMYRIYGSFDQSLNEEPETLITEDSDAGFEFYQKTFGTDVISAHGKSNIFQTLVQTKGRQRLVIADGAAFGAEIDRVVKEIYEEGTVTLFLPESFEWLILKSGIIDGNYVREILSNPADHIESQSFFSWERYFTSLLVAQTKDTYLRYSKSKLNRAYLSKNIAEKILELIPGLKTNDDETQGSRDL